MKLCIFAGNPREGAELEKAFGDKAEYVPANPPPHRFGAALPWFHSADPDAVLILSAHHVSGFRLPEGALGLFSPVFALRCAEGELASTVIQAAARAAPSFQSMRGPLSQAPYDF